MWRTSLTQINRSLEPFIPVPGRCAGYSQSVYCWSWVNSAGLSAIHPPSLIFRQQGPLWGDHKLLYFPCWAGSVTLAQ